MAFIPAYRDEKETDTTKRIKKHLVTFHHPFRIDDLEEELPAGSYTIETEEESLDSMSFLAFRHVSTTLIVRPPSARKGQTRFLLIDPDGLASALKRDVERTARSVSSEKLKDEPPHEQNV